MPTLCLKHAARESIYIAARTMSQNTYHASGTPSKQEQADQNARLTNRHIQTLSFLQDVARENKELKARVDELEVGKIGIAFSLHIKSIIR